MIKGKVFTIEECNQWYKHTQGNTRFKPGQQITLNDEYSGGCGSKAAWIIGYIQDDSYEVNDDLMSLGYTSHEVYWAVLDSGVVTAIWPMEASPLVA